MSTEIETTESVPVSRKQSKKRLPRLDSFFQDAEKVTHAEHHGANDDWVRTLSLAFQSIGVVYGDLGTSPLYVYASTFTDGIKHKDDILGVLSLIIYTLLLLPMLKYVFIVLRANDNGDGGTFALYSLISRYAKISLVPNQQAEDALVSNYHLEGLTPELKRAHGLKNKLENSTVAKILIFICTILATSMVMGDGVLTPLISVISAVGGGLTEKVNLTTNQVDWISAAIFVLIFAVQRFGTDKVGYSFAPIVSLYFLFIGGIGLYNLIHYDIGVLRAFNPKYIVDYFSRNGKQGWISLGGVLLCYTGTEAMFADLGHFSVRAVQLGFSCALFPAVSLAYIGQAAYLRKYPEDVASTYYKSIPSPLYWPTFVVSVGAAIIASQAMISGAFAIISQSQTLGCFPRVKVLHTSKKYEGQVYIPEVNFALGLVCVIFTFVYKDTTKIGNAYGIAVTTVMFITTIFLALVMLLIWKISIFWIILFFTIFGSAELIFLSSALYKFKDGGYFPIAVAAVLMALMGIWHYVHVKKYWYELTNMVSKDKLEELTQRRCRGRIPGIGFLYSELVQGVPPIFAHLVEKVPYIHSVLVFVSVKTLPIPYVSSTERFIFRQAEPKGERLFRCVARYGYNDKKEDANAFAASLIEQLKSFVHDESLFAQITQSQLNNENIRLRPGAQSAVHVEEKLAQISGTQAEQISEPQHKQEEKQIYEQELANGVVYLLGETEVRAERNSGFFKKIIVNYVYNFLKKNFRQGDKALLIPRDQILKVGMVYEI
jgi:KUP system potassium uptake protein